jgi:hypothetical protein
VRQKSFIKQWEFFEQLGVVEGRKLVSKMVTVNEEQASPSYDNRAIQLGSLYRPLF